MRFSSAALLLASVLAAAPSHAQSSEDERRNAARDFGVQGNQAYDAGDFTRAVDLYQRAQALYPAPTLSVRLGRTLVKLGRLVEAEEAYIKTLRYPLPEDAPDAFKQAIQVAKGDLAELSPRVPRLKVSVVGAKEFTVTLNGARLETALVGIERKVDPGEYKIRAEAPGAEPVEQTVKVAERAHEAVSLTLKVDPAKAPRKQPGPTGASMGMDSGGEPEGRSPLPFIALGVGGAGIAVGVITGLMASSKHSSAESECQNLKCERGSQGESDLQSFRDLRTVSTIGYIVGAVGIAAGGVLWFTTAPSADARAASRVTPYVGLGHAGVWGSF
ncbi:MAG: hypothetical protein R3B07_13180 [Polyangiaceae bacterium]